VRGIGLIGATLAHTVTLFTIALVPRAGHRVRSPDGGSAGEPRGPRDEQGRVQGAAGAMEASGAMGPVWAMRPARFGDRILPVGSSLLGLTCCSASPTRSPIRNRRSSAEIPALKRKRPTSILQNFAASGTVWQAAGTRARRSASTDSRDVDSAFNQGIDQRPDNLRAVEAGLDLGLVPVVVQARFADRTARRRLSTTTLVHWRSAAGRLKGADSRRRFISQQVADCNNVFLLAQTQL
jgi:hypothetical protein